MGIHPVEHPFAIEHTRVSSLSEVVQDKVVMLGHDLRLNCVQIEALNDLGLVPKDLVHIVRAPNNLAIIFAYRHLQDEGVSISQIDVGGAFEAHLFLQTLDFSLALPRLLRFEGDELVVKPNDLGDIQALHYDGLDVGEDLLDDFPSVQNFVANHLDCPLVVDFVANKGPELEGVSHQFAYLDLKLFLFLVVNLHFFKVELIVSLLLRILLMNHPVHLLEYSLHHSYLQSALLFVPHLSMVGNLLITLGHVLDHLQIVHYQDGLVMRVVFEVGWAVLEDGRDQLLEENQALEWRNA